ncbi:MAG: UDP-glucose/GDP-mannose dehydrogenase family protein [Candidatus Margulisbacteria bacterium]|nr:UDP-glucose/GDP-mannose dehydrogenase family protein [Candidatus Margulisiibacteriota bacterium]MBU1021504.1 UDP-glucose/GDP-mannose dehydrogenase family protein [Candidatus Margulisiibacteriota bacterium]MBU1728589.1 UDP-glucose/GDP-mannose dehydrogenase family protein [Candidatus Margulisiibacteriota bacterium]MBU1955832.1 UDP-glucose/GDP-mannose dehydrogenase family protein [Candidatus Margulisiibacteriota bacterium]
MKISVIGSGYVGLVTGACLAELGHQVTCVDVDKLKIKLLSSGKIPIFEPGLEELVLRNVSQDRLAFSSAIASTVKKSEVIFIAVGTPSRADGEADVSAVESVAKEIAKAIKGPSGKAGAAYKVIVNKSTVPVGMGDIVTKLLIKNGVAKNRFAVVSNPEFLREGSALDDFMHPDRIVIGAQDKRAYEVITELYRPLNAHIIFTSIKSAELIKYASNAFLATKISFINEIANVCERVGSDVSEVADAVGLDKRIGRAFLSAGLGWGGSCFPKDVSALIHLARAKGYNPEILESVLNVNQAQVEMFVGKIKKTLKNLNGKVITVLGLSFKPNTDDLREAPSLKVIELLLSEGAKLKAYDPIVKNVDQLKNKGMISLADDPYEALQGSQALVIVTEWPEFTELDLKKAKQLMQKPYVFDGRNTLNAKRVKEAGFKYFGIGK